MKVQLRTGDRYWLAVPPVEYRWALLGAYHDRLGHAGASQTLAFVHQHFHWPGIKADIEAFIRQCHACQVRRLELQDMVHVGLPRMSGPFEHVHIDLAGPFELRVVSDSPRRKKHGATRAALSTHASGSAYVAIIVDYFTKAAEFAFLPDKQAATVARAFHDSWLMRYGLPEWLTSDNGSEFAGAFRHQLERFGVEHVPTSAYHPQSNGAAERLVATLKSILAAKVAGSLHDWPSLLPQTRMEYMQRVHSATGYSPNELVFATKPRLPPPVGALRWDARAAAAAVAPDVDALQETLSQSDISHHVATRDECAQKLYATAYDRILARQHKHAAQQHARRSRRRKGGKQLRVGDLAYLLTRSGGFKPKVEGPFVVLKISDHTVELRTTALVEGQPSKTFSVHLERVARATTVTDVLETLLKQAKIVQEQAPTDPDVLARRHVRT
jgi:transposase InsO family protein